MTPAQVADKVYQALRRAGATPAGACAVLGNLEQESSLDPTCVESNGEGIGLVQWSFGRKATFLRYCANRGKPWQDLDVQIGFMLAELKGGDYTSSWRLISTTRDPYTAAIEFHRLYEGSNDSESYVVEHRAKPAQRWYERLVGPLPTALHIVRVGGRTPLSRVEVIRQSGMSSERFTHHNPRTPDPVPAGTPVKVPVNVTAIHAGRDRR